MPIIFHPHIRYLVKQCFGVLLSLPFQLLLFAFFTNGLRIKDGATVIWLLAPFILLISGISLVGAILAYRNIRYEITEDEIIVHSGVLNKSTKHVPFRTITNMQVTRGFWDRLFGLGTLEIQTAGTGGTKAEEKLVGLDDVQGTYEYVAKVLRGFRNSMSPTQAGSESSQSKQGNSERELLVHILNELRAIRKEIHQSNRS
jgi:uncharacterized membrane protein YdbT with pleckstrin-like domain